MRKRFAASSNFYQVLGVPNSASATEIQGSYRRMALQSHPDKGGSKETFHLVVSAFETLSSPWARKMYDEWLMRRKCQKNMQLKASRQRRPVSRGLRSDEGNAARKPRRLVQALRRLLDVLNRFQDVDERRSALRELPASVSGALLLFMEQQANPWAPGKAEAEGKRSGPRSSPTDRNEDQCGLSMMKPLSASRQVDRQTRTGYRGVMYATRQSRLYQACVHFSNLRIVTRSVQTLEEAIGFHSLLVAIKELAAKEEGSAAFETRVRGAIETVCRENCTDPTSLGLAFRVVVNARHMVHTSVFSRYSHDLDDVLRKREMLLNTKAAGWPSFRDAWVEIMQTPSPNHQASKVPRGGSRTASEAARVADAAWEAHCERRKSAFVQACRQQEKHAVIEARRSARRRRFHSRLKLRMAQAVRVVEKAVVAERQCRAKQIAAANRRDAALRIDEARKRKHHELEAQKREREERCRRKALWRWMNDRKRTTEEILRGPPQDLAGASAHPAMPTVDHTRESAATTSSQAGHMITTSIHAQADACAGKTHFQLCLSR